MVAGLGALGAAAAGALAARGLEVVGLDLHRPPHGLGSSHGGSRIIRRVYPEGPAYVPLVDRAFELWRQLERRRGEDLLLAHGGLFLGPDDGELVAAALDCARRAGLDHDRLTAAEVRRRFPALRPPGELTAVFDPAAGVLLAERCVRALLVAAAADGAELRFDCPLTGWRITGDGVALETARGPLRAGHLVLAAGPWLPALVPAGQAAPVVERQVQHWFATRGSTAAPAALPPFVWQLGPGRTWYALPDLGAGLKAARHRGGRATTIQTVDRAVASGEKAAIRRLVRTFLPAAGGPCLRSEVCLYSNTADLAFLAGPVVPRGPVWLLGGGSGHGFKFAPALGELLARGIVESRPPAELRPFLPSRSSA